MKQTNKQTNKQIDIYFDNVGGVMLDKVLGHMKSRGRIICCGAISQYSNQGEQYGVKNTFKIVAKQLTMQGFLLNQWKSEHAAGAEVLRGMLETGTLQHRETIVEGFESVPAAMISLLTGGNTGKISVRV